MRCGRRSHLCPSRGSTSAAAPRSAIRTASVVSAAGSLRPRLVDPRRATRGDRGAHADHRRASPRVLVQAEALPRRRRARGVAMAANRGRARASARRERSPSPRRSSMTGLLHPSRRPPGAPGRKGCCPGARGLYAITADRPTFRRCARNDCETDDRSPTLAPWLYPRRRIQQRATRGLLPARRADASSSATGKGLAMVMISVGASPPPGAPLKS